MTYWPCPQIISVYVGWQNKQNKISSVTVEGCIRQPLMGVMKLTEPQRSGQEGSGWKIPLGKPRTSVCHLNSEVKEGRRIKYGGAAQSSGASSQAWSVGLLRIQKPG